jgi:hypothetical protein
MRSEVCRQKVLKTLIFGVLTTAATSPLNIHISIMV